MWLFAVKTLAADRGKLLTALVGVVFSVVLVNIQCGLFLGMIRKASMLVDHGEAQIWVGHRKVHDVEYPRDIPRRWAYRIRPIEGVRNAEPHLLGFSQMSLPSGGFEGVVVVGVDRASRLGDAWNLQEGSSNAILQTDGIIVDRREDAKLESPTLGEVREVGGKRARVTGKSDGIVGFTVAPYIFTSYERAVSYLDKRLDSCSYILVELDSGTDVQQVCHAIRQRLPEADVHPKEEYAKIVVNFWLTRTGLGISFGASTLLGLLVGMVMVGETLYATVLDRLSEYGTLKAIGATEWQIQSVLLVQSISMALVGSIIGLGIVYFVQQQFTSPKAPILIPMWLSWGSCVLVLMICLVSSYLPYLRIRKVDPLMVLQS